MYIYISFLTVIQRHPPSEKKKVMIKWCNIEVEGSNLAAMCSQLDSGVKIILEHIKPAVG